MPITYIVCWYKILYQVEPVVSTSITFATSCNAFSSQNRQDQKQNLVSDWLRFSISKENVHNDEFCCSPFIIHPVGRILWYSVPEMDGRPVAKCD